MKISRLGVTLGLAAMVAGAFSSNAQTSSNSPSVGVVADFIGAPIIDVFGIPAIVDTTDLDFTLADSSVFTDGGGKISGFATGTVTPTTGTAADIVATVTGSIASKGTTPVLKVTIKGSGAPSDGTISGKSSFKLTFASVGPATTSTVTTNVIDPNNPATYTLTTNEVPTDCVTNCITNIVGGVTNVDCSDLGTNVVCASTNFVVTTNATTVTNTVVGFSGKVTGTYKSGVKGEKAISFKNVDADVLDIDSTDLNVSIGVVGAGKKLYAAGRITPGLPVVGSGGTSKSKFTIKLKGTGVGKGSSLTLSGASATDGETGDVTVSGVKASGKVLGQKVDKTADDADVTVSPGLPAGGAL